MKQLSFIVAEVLPYISITVLVLGTVYRAGHRLKAPRPAAGALSLFPLAQRSSTWALVSDTLGCPYLVKADRGLWLLASLLHLGLLIAFVGHLRLLTGVFDVAALRLGMTPEALSTLSSSLGRAVGTVLLAAGVALAMRRLVIRSARQASAVQAYFNIALLLVVFVSGFAIRCGYSDVGIEEVRLWWRSLLVLAPRAPQSTAFLIHVAFAQVLLIWLPFSDLLHVDAAFLNHRKLRRLRP